MNKDPLKFVHPAIVNFPSVFKSPTNRTGRHDHIFFEMAICNAMVYALKKRHLSQADGKSLLSNLRESVNKQIGYTEESFFSLLKFQSEKYLCLIDHSRGVYPLILTDTDDRTMTQGKNISTRKAFAASLDRVEKSWNKLYDILLSMSKDKTSEFETYKKKKALKDKISRIVPPPPKRAA